MTHGSREPLFQCKVETVLRTVGPPSSLFELLLRGGDAGAVGEIAAVDQLLEEVDSPLAWLVAVIVAADDMERRGIWRRDVRAQDHERLIMEPVERRLAEDGSVPMVRGAGLEPATMDLSRRTAGAARRTQTRS
jgi:hypothetical protein